MLSENNLVYVEPKGLLSKKKKLTVHSIMPDTDLTNERANEFLKVHYNRIFSEILDTIKDKKVISWNFGRLRGYEFII